MQEKLRVRIADKELIATLADNRTAADFASLLPLKIKMRDLFRREKYGALPRKLSEGGERAFTYRIGQIIYWSPGPDVAIYYRDDGEKIPKPGIIVLGTIEAGTQLFDIPGNIDVIIERAE